MRIVLIGAKGMIGQRILRAALKRGHEVTAIIRDLSQAPTFDENLTLVQGDVFDEALLANTFSGKDAVISAFGPKPGKEKELVEATKALIKGVKNAGVPRLLAIGGAASLEVAPGVKLIDTPEFPEAWKAIASAHAEALEIYRKETEIDWTNLSPAAMIAPGESTGKYRTDNERLVVDEQGQSRISAEDYAMAMIDELENPKHSRMRFTVAY